MMNTKYLLLLFFILFITAHGIRGQSFNVIGTTQSADSKTALPGASIKAISEKDSTVWYGTVSSLDGKFSIDVPAPGNYILQIRYVGFESYSLNITAIAGETLNIGDVRMKESTKMLKGIVVEDTAQRVTLKGDTAVYNADSFKVNRDADASKLLEKMPGVTNSGGTISVQGETVQKVLVDGKEFFGNDPKTALNTLPAEIISKIEVFDQLSEQSQFTGFNDGNTVKTINIITKAGKNQGEFGKVFGGYGTDNRYLLGGNVNKFNGDERISLLALSNNVNQVNFATEDIAGAVGSTVDAINNPPRGPRRQSAGTGSASDFLVAPENGINTTSAIGFNYSNNFGKKLKLNGSYFFNTTDNINDNTLKRTFSGGNAEGQIYEEQNTSRTENTNHRINLRAEYDMDDKNSFLLKPSIGFQDFEANNNQLFRTTLLDTIFNSGTNFTTQSSQSMTFSNELLFRRKMAKKGQTFSISLQSNINGTDGLNSLFNELVDVDGVLQESEDWRSERDQTSQNQRLNISYTHPLSDKVSLELGYRPEWTKSTSDWDTRNPDASNDYSLVDSTLSNKFESTFFTHEARLRLRIQAGKGGFAVAGFNYEYTENDNNQTFPSEFNNLRIYRNPLPFALFRKTFENKASFFALYRMSANLPSIQQLNTVIDNSNPFQVSVGNINLDQALGHRFVIRYNLTNTDKGTNFFALISADAQDGRISNATTVVTADTLLANGYILPAGGQITQPVNLDGYVNFRTFANYGFPVKVLRSNLNLNATLTGQKSPGLIDNELNYAQTIGLNTGIVLGSNISERVDFKIGASTAMNWVTNSLNGQDDFNYLTYTANAGGVFTPISRWVISTDFSVNIYRGLGDLDQEFLIWNAGVGYRLLKDESLEVRVSAFDLLSQNNSVSRTVTETYVEDRETDILQRYIMLSVSYRLRSFRPKPE